MPSSHVGYAADICMIIIIIIIFIRVPTHPGKSWNLSEELLRPGKSWKMTVVMKSHGKVTEFHQ